ncbi:hypothetical protein V2I01_36270 [Micromonospora sp. BRA006-A]|nr:hypothetical protein [Micromonospora sp. BRA006-A]
MQRLLDRLAEVCEARYDRVVVRRVGTDPPHLYISYRSDGVVRQQRVGAHVGTPTAADVDVFARRVHATDPDIASELVYDGDRVPRGLAEEAQRRASACCT